MAYSEMTIAPTATAEPGNIAYEATETLAAAGAGKWFLVPPGVEGIAVTLAITSGSGYVQTTTEGVDRVKAGSAAGVTWDKGTISATAQDWAMPVTAFRAFNVSGTVVLHARAS